MSRRGEELPAVVVWALRDSSSWDTHLTQWLDHVSAVRDAVLDSGVRPSDVPAIVIEVDEAEALGLTGETLEKS